VPDNRTCDGPQPLISVVVPFYNEEENARAAVTALLALQADAPGCNFQIICVNDGSRDGTLDVLRDLALTNSSVVVLDLIRNFGKEAAMTAGLDFATGDALVFIDGDLQHPPSLIPEMIRRWQGGTRSVAAKRRTRNTDSYLYRLLTAYFYRVSNRISDITLIDGVGDFRLIDKTIADDLRRLKENRRFMKGLFAWADPDPQLLEYDVSPRSAGSSSFNGWRSWNFALEGITSYSTIPLRLWTYVGLALIALGGTYASWVVIQALLYGVTAPGYVTLLSAVILFGGIQLIGIGVLGEYVGRIYMEVKERPPYLVRSVLNDPRNT